MVWANWFSKAADAQDASGAAAASADAGAVDAGQTQSFADPVPYDEQVLQAGWIPAERVDGAAAERAQAPASGEDALQDALAFLARVYNNQGC